MRRPRHAVRHDDQPLAHRAEHRPHQRAATLARSTCTSTTRRATSRASTCCTYLDDDGTFDVDGVQAHGRGRCSPRRRSSSATPTTRPRRSRETSRRVPPARPRLRQPRRAADGGGPALRLRRRPGVGRRDHRADDRPRLRDERAHRGADGSVRGLRRERRARCSTCCACTAPRRPRSTRSSCPPELLDAAQRSWDEAVELGELLRRAQLAGDRARADGLPRRRFARRRPSAASFAWDRWATRSATSGSRSASTCRPTTGRGPRRSST